MDSQYKVRLEVFEGPLDLLLYLVRKEEVDVYDIAIERVTSQYLEYLDAMAQLDLEIAGEFLVMAATLMYIKSRNLLPADQQPPEEEAEEDDPRWELIRQLIEYKKFKDAAGQLHFMEATRENLFHRIPPERASLEQTAPVVASLVDLIGAFNKVLRRLEARGEIREIHEENFTVAGKIEHILAVTSGGRAIGFAALFSNAASRTEIVVTFLALLELIRLKRLQAEQLTPFGEITISRASGAPDDAGLPESGVDDSENSAAEALTSSETG